MKQSPNPPIRQSTNLPHEERDRPLEADAVPVVVFGCLYRLAHDVRGEGSGIDSMTIRGQVLDALTHRPYQAEGAITAAVAAPASNVYVSGTISQIANNGQFLLMMKQSAK